MPVYPGALKEIFRQLSNFCAKLTVLLPRIAVLPVYADQEAYSQTGRGCSLPDLWRGAGREMRIEHGTAPHRATS